MIPTDADLVQQALGGSQAAYHALVARYATPAVNLAARMVQDRALAEDLAQEAFTRAFERLSTYERISLPGTEAQPPPDIPTESEITQRPLHA